MPTETFLPDVNVLIALAWPQHVHHERAHRWFSTIGSWATTPVTETAFVRISSTPDVVGTGPAPGDVLAALRSMRASSGHRFLPDGASPAAPRIAETPATRRQVADLHLVDLAVSADAVLATMDRGIPALLGEESRRHVLLIP